MAEKPPWAPWETIQFVSFLHMPLPKLHIHQKGWREKDHSDILIKKEKIIEEKAWEIKKKCTNPYEFIFTGTLDSPFPSLAAVNPLSRSYFKMIEMTEVMKFWSFLREAKQNSITTVHICEGPGGFVQHTVQALRNLQIEKTKIYAMTLKPTKAQIPGWKRSSGFLRKYPEITLEYGEDDTGNVLLKENQRNLCKKVGGKALLFTADGGFDFSIDYSKQEEAVFQLLLASFLLGLQTLAKGGFMIIKLFDMYSQATRDLLIGTSIFFKDFTIYKPATSRPCNAERYFLARGYEGQEAATSWIHFLSVAQEKHKASPLTSLFDFEWPERIQNLFDEQIKWHILKQRTRE